MKIKDYYNIMIIILYLIINKRINIFQLLINCLIKTQKHMFLLILRDEV